MSNRNSNLNNNNFNGLDISLSDEQIYISREIDAFLQEVAIILFTKPYAVLGYSDFSIDYGQYFYAFDPDVTGLENKIKTAITTYSVYANMINWTIGCDILKGKYENVLVVEINIYTDETNNSPITKYFFIGSDYDNDVDLTND